jgi:hypothetical protein
MIERTNFNETHCNMKGIQTVIDTNVRQCISEATRGEINKASHHLKQHNDKNLPHRKLRSAAPPRELQNLAWCNEGCHCATVENCQMLYCTDSCGGGSTCACDDRRNMEEEDDEPRFLSWKDPSPTIEFGSAVVHEDHENDACGSWKPNGRRLSQKEAESFLSCHCEKALTLVAEMLEREVKNKCLGDYIDLVCHVFLRTV